MSELAGIIKRARTARAWPQEQLAEAAGVSLRTVQRVERGDPCAKETLQALAAALGLEAGVLVAAAPVERDGRVLGLSATAAFWIGAALCAPTLLFVVSNVGYYVFDLAWMGPARPEVLFGPWVDNIIVMLGLPLIALAICATQLFGVKWKPGPDSLIIEGVVLRWRPAHLAVAAMAGGLFTLVAIVVLRERLFQMIATISG
jgi:transcriptional regulator with XRE-family HTH domain